MNDNNPLPAFKLTRGHGLVLKDIKSGSMALARSALASRPRTSVVFCLTRVDLDQHLFVRFEEGQTQWIKEATWAKESPASYVLYTIKKEHRMKLEEQCGADLPRELAKLANSICPKETTKHFEPGDIKLEIVAV